MKQIGVQPVLVNTAQTATVAVDLVVPKDAIGCILRVVASDNPGGAQTLDIKLQDIWNGTAIDIPGASLVQITTSDANVSLKIYPGITVVNNVALAGVIGPKIRVLFTIGAGASFNINAQIAWLG